MIPPATANSTTERTVDDLSQSDSVEIKVEIEQEFEEDVELSYRVRDEHGVEYSLGENPNVIQHVEALIDDEWVEVEDWQVIEKDLSNCRPHDYVIILDMSGSMSKNADLIENEANSFIQYKNDEDQVALIKYASSPLLVSNYSNVADTLTHRLNHVADTSIGGGTKTGLAYGLYWDSLREKNPNERQSVMLFSDISGSAMHKFDSLAKVNFKSGISTHKVIYFREEEKNSFVFKFLTFKKQIRTAFDDQFGNVYRVDDLHDIGASLKRIIDQNCSYSKILFKRLPNTSKYRIVSELDGKKVRSTVISSISLGDTMNSSPDSTISFGDESYRVGEPILLNVYFNTGSDALLNESHDEIDRVFQVLNEYPNMTIEIRGHTDNRGTKSYNEELSERRAKSVRNALIEKGVDPKRMKAKGFGYQQPVATNETEQGRAKNRRTEFVIVEI